MPRGTSPNHCLDQLSRLGRVDVARNHQARIVRGVVLAKEFDDVIVTGGGEIFHVADGRPVIRMILRVQHLAEDDFCHAVRLVLVTLPPLVFDDVALTVDALWRHGVQQIRHAIGFEEERQLERVRRDIDEIVRPVIVRRTVVAPPGTFEQRVEFAFLNVLGTLEHQVLEQVCKTRSPGSLIGRPDVVPHVHRHHRNGMVFVQNHVKSVRQRELRVRHRQLEADRLRRLRQRTSGQCGKKCSKDEKG